MLLQHKSKSHVYKELKQVVGFKEYLKYDFLRYPWTFWGNHGLFEELGRHAKRICPRNVLIVEHVVSVEHVLFEYTSYDSQGQNFGTIWSKFLLRKHSKLLITAAFCRVLFGWKARYVGKRTIKHFFDRPSRFTNCTVVSFSTIPLCADVVTLQGRRRCPSATA